MTLDDYFLMTNGLPRHQYDQCPCQLQSHESRISHLEAQAVLGDLAQENASDRVVPDLEIVM